MQKLGLFLVLLMVAQPLRAQIPECYKKVDRLIWVVDDLDKVVNAWKKLGFEQIRDFGEVELQGEQFRGKPAKARLRVAGAMLGSAQVRWLQPLSGDNAYSEFLTRHGSGVFSLVHRMPTRAALQAETKRLAGLGVGILEQGGVDGAVGSLSYAYMDTEKEGKYVLGLIYVEDPKSSEMPAQAPMGLKLSQYAFVARDPRPVSAYWRKLGLPEMTYTRGPLREMIYRGKPAEFDMELGWQRHGQVVYEWIHPLSGPMIYFDFLKAHGEGFHHLAFDVDDIDKVTESWKRAGFPSIMSGAWGNAGKAGSGRFSYSDADPFGGIAVEFLWNFR